MISSVLVVLSLVVVLEQGSYSIQTSNGPIVVDGDTATGIVTTHPGANALVISGESGMFEHDGTSWAKIGGAPPPGLIAWAGGDSGLMLAGDHAQCMRGGPGTPLHRSDTAGVSWEPVEGSLDFRPIAIWAEPALALASSCAGLQVSLDGGLTWSPMTGIEPGWDLTAFAEIPQADGSGPMALVGLTGEGGTSYLRSIDFSDPSAPVVSDDLRIYYALAGLAGAGDTYFIAAIDGVWISEDAGAHWERSAEGLDEVVLEFDPAEHGFPEDVDPRAYGLFAITGMPGDEDLVLVGTADGVYMTSTPDEPWSKVEGTSGRVNQVVLSGDGSSALYATDDGVYLIDLTAAG